MSATHSAGTRVRWLVVGSFLPSPSGRRFLLTEDSFAEQLEHAASGLRVTVQDRIGSGDASTYELSLDTLSAFQLSEVVDSIPDLRALRKLHGALSRGGTPDREEAARLQSLIGEGRLHSAVARALRMAVEPDPRAGDALPSTKGVL